MSVAPGRAVRYLDRLTVEAAGGLAHEAQVNEPDLKARQCSTLLASADACLARKLSAFHGLRAGAVEATARWT